MTQEEKLLLFARLILRIIALKQFAFQSPAEEKEIAKLVEQANPLANELVSDYLQVGQNYGIDVDQLLNPKTLNVWG